MASKNQKKHCKGCVHYWTQGLSKNHCCKFGKDADKAYGQCVITSARLETNNDPITKRV